MLKITFIPGELKLIVVDKIAKVKILLEECKSENINLGTIITVEKPDEEVKTMAEETQINLKTFEEILEAGKKELKDFVVRTMNPCTFTTNSKHHAIHSIL